MLYSNDEHLLKDIFSCVLSQHLRKILLTAKAIKTGDLSLFLLLFLSTKYIFCVISLQN